MRVLIVCSGNFPNFRFEVHQSFIYEQMRAIMEVDSNVEFERFFVTGRGFKGYILQFHKLKQTIDTFRPDVIHAHYGLCGLLANIQRKVPVVTTYHGSDINCNSSKPFSSLSIFLSTYNIFVSRKLSMIANAKRCYSVIPCGVCVESFPIVDKIEARKRMGLCSDDYLVLFSNSFDNRVKNSALAMEAVSRLRGVKLLELKGYSRDEVSLMLNACNVALMTSFTEGSPQFIKEAMVCGCPIVSVDVGDVSEVISDTEGCYIAERDAEDVAYKLSLALSFNGRTNGRDRIIKMGYDSRSAATKILGIYEAIVY